MKYLKLIASSFLLYFLILATGTPFSSCTKKDLIHDTTVVHVHDTTITHVHDTTVKIDTVYDITTGLVAYYTFTGGSLHDSSGNGNDIFLNNGATLVADRFGNSNSAFQFNGTTSYMQVHNSLSLNPNNITLMAVVKVNAFNTLTNCNANNIIGKGEPDNIDGWYILRFQPPTVCSAPSIDSAHESFTASFGDDVPQGASAGILADTVIGKGAWYTVVYTYDGTTSKLYINGKLRGSQVKNVLYSANTHDLFIGKYEDPNFPYIFDGVIDEIRIYNRAVTQSQVTQFQNLTR